MDPKSEGVEVAHRLTRRWDIGTGRRGEEGRTRELDVEQPRYAFQYDWGCQVPEEYQI